MHAEADRWISPIARPAVSKEWGLRGLDDCPSTNHAHTITYWGTLVLFLRTFPHCELIVVFRDLRD